GAASPGRLWLTTGLHTGEVRLRIQLHDGEPRLDDSWEEIVEASFTPATAAVGLYPWGSNEPVPLAIDPVSHRVRYSATAMDAARAQDTLLAGESPIDAYALDFWPRPPAPDRVVKQTSAVAAYW